MANQVRDLFLYVPRPVIVAVCRSRDISTAGRSKLELAELLVKAVGAAELEQLLDKHRYAGRGSVVWFRPTRNGKTVDLDSKVLAQCLREYCGADPFTSDLRPDLGHRPKVVNAKSLSATKLLIQMAYLEMRPHVVGFEIQEEEEIVFCRLIIRRDSLFFEARASRNKAVQMAEDIASALGCSDKGQIVFDDDDMNALITQLGASVIAAKHKHVSGDFDTTEVVVSPQLGDLQESTLYASSLGTLEGRRKRIYFECSFGAELLSARAELYPRTGNFIFRSYVDERVMDYVFQAVKQVKGF